jgi:hypothetical protein
MKEHGVEECEEMGKVYLSLSFLKYILSVHMNSGLLSKLDSDL